MSNRIFALLSLGFLFISHANSQRYCNPTRFSNSPCPPAPNYAQMDNWSALPTKKDPSDDCPRGLKNKQASAPADVFFIHPTTYTEKPNSSGIKIYAMPPSTKSWTKVRFDTKHLLSTPPEKSMPRDTDRPIIRFS